MIHKHAENPHLPVPESTSGSTTASKHKKKHKVGLSLLLNLGWIIDHLETVYLGNARGTISVELSAGKQENFTKYRAD